MCYRHAEISFDRDCPHCGASQCNEQMFCTECGRLMPHATAVPTPVEQVSLFFQQVDEDGLTNEYKVKRNQHVLRRTKDTDLGKSVDAVNPADSQVENGMVIKDGKLVGLGIDIFNEDVYPLQSFEIYLRGCHLSGNLNLNNCADMVYLDVYGNWISTIRSKNMPAMRIFGVQGNWLKSIDLSEMPALQGVDAGKNQLTKVDTSHNPELVELYVNNNNLTSVDISANPKLKYFYCHFNSITQLDATANPLLRHFDCTHNPLTSVKAFAPLSDGQKPLQLTAEEGGHVSMVFKPVYNAQWKETGEWDQAYYAEPQEGREFEGWYDQDGALVSDQRAWHVEYGSSHVLTARFRRDQA